jgi:hypothetical protein
VLADDVIDLAVLLGEGDAEVTLQEVARDTADTAPQGFVEAVAGSRLARISGLMARPPESGSPGTLCMARKVAVAMNQTVITPSTRRRSR